MSQSLLGQPFTGKYIIEGNANALAKVYLFHDIIGNRDIMNYILQIFSKVLVEEYDTIIMLFFQLFEKQRRSFTKCQYEYYIHRLYSMLDDIGMLFPMKSKFNSVNTIEPAFLLLMLQHNHEIIFKGKDIVYIHYNIKHMMNYHGVMHNIGIRCWGIPHGIYSFHELLFLAISDRLDNKHNDKVQFVVTECIT